MTTYVGFNTKAAREMGEALIAAADKVEAAGFGYVYTPAVEVIFDTTSNKGELKGRISNDTE